MAVNKVVNKSTKTHGAMRNVIEYVLRDSKVQEGYVAITGPYAPTQIDWNNVYLAFLEEKRLWNKDTGRMYAHNIISFHKDEAITPEQCLEIGKIFVEKFFPEHQSLIGVHQDKEHLHIHIVTNSVSYIDGRKLHQTKRDLEHQKDFTNKLCVNLGLSVTKKGKHFDGSTIDEGEVIAWNKDKYNLLQNESKNSYVADCAIAILESRDKCCSKEEFIERMHEHGWNTIWTDKRKHITFENGNGDKVRDTNISKSFSMDINKEVLEYEFERQNAIRLANAEDGFDFELEQYYTEVETAIEGTGINTNAIGSNTEITNRTTTTPDTNTSAFIRELELKERASEQKRDDSITKRENRELKRERSRVEAERAAKIKKLRLGKDREIRQRRSPDRTM